MYEKFGKSFQDILGLKQSFFEDNDRLLHRTLAYADLYNSQPRRLNCKICEEVLPQSPTFTKHRISYVVCVRCSHLNGWHEDTDEFCNEIYSSAGGAEYAKAYRSVDREAYLQRRSSIYVPKAEFLLDVLEKEGLDTKGLKYSDMGAGAGYFVSALQSLGVDDVVGYEVGEAQVKLGLWMEPELPLRQISLSDTVGLVRDSSADVVTFIGVFEHLQRPREILQAIRANASIKYFYFCVPMFSSCIYNEMAFANVMPRQLAIGHTHLFTRDSIDHFAREFDMEPVGAWWFGTDVMDYYRSVQVTLSSDPDLTGAVNGWDANFTDLIDDMQLAIDRRRASSQVHMLMRVS